MRFEYLPPPKQNTGPTGIPVLVLTSAILWILFAAFLLFGGVMLFVGGQSGFFQLLVGGSYLATAIRVLCAKPKSILGGGIASILLGVLLLLGAAAAMSPAGNTAGMPPLAIGFGFAAAVLLLVSGIFAGVANTAYQAWRAERNPEDLTAAPVPLTHDELIAHAPACPSCWVAMSFDGETASWHCVGCES